jgi:hypothetical protein
VLPNAWKLPDGYQTTIAFAAEQGVRFWEKTVKPLSVLGGEEIDTTTMLNVKWHTFWPRSLVKSGPVSGKAAYDPVVLNDILILVNLPTVITVHHPDHASETFFGYLRDWDPEEREEGKLPLATYTVVVTNTDYTTSAEVPPLFTAAPGTN